MEDSEGDCYRKTRPDRHGRTGRVGCFRIDSNFCLPNKRVDFQTMVARVENLELRLKDKDFSDSVGEVRLPNEVSIKVTESTQNRFIQQWRSLTSSKFIHKTLDDRKRRFLRSSNAETLSQGDATKGVRAMLDCSCKEENGTERWNREGKRYEKLSGWRKGTRFMRRRMQCSPRSYLR